MKCRQDCTRRVTDRSWHRPGPDQEIIPLPGIYFFDGWRVHPTLTIPSNLATAPKKRQSGRHHSNAAPSASTEPTRSPEEDGERHPGDSHAKNQAVTDGPNTRRAAVPTRARRHVRSAPCENKTVAILEQMQAGIKALIHTDGGKWPLSLTGTPGRADRQCTTQTVNVGYPRHLLRRDHWRRAPSNISGTDFRAITLPIHAT